MLRGLNSFGRFVYKGDNFCDFLLVFFRTSPLVKRRLQEFASVESKSFILRVDPFSERDKINLETSPESVTFPLRMRDGHIFNLSPYVFFL